MKFTVAQSDFYYALKVVSKAVGSARMHPILCNVLLEAVDGKLAVTCYNIDLGIRTNIVAIAEKGGAITVPHKLLTEIVGKIDRQSAINVVADDEQLILQTPAGKYKLAAKSAEDFPDLPKINSDKAATISIADSLRAVLSCCSQDESKQVLTGIHLVADGKTLRLEATDGHRLSIRKQPCEASGLNLLIPAKTMQQVLRVDSPTVSISSDDYQTSIAIDDDTTIVGRVLDGTFPDVDKLIPGSFQHTLTVNRRKLLDSLDRLAIVSDEGRNIVKLKASDELGDLEITAESETGSGVESLMAMGTLPDLAFNVHYLIDGLRHLESEEVEIKAITSITPVIVKESNNDDSIYLVMPVQARQ